MRTWGQNINATYEPVSARDVVDSTAESLEAEAARLSEEAAELESSAAKKRKRAEELRENAAELRQTSISPVRGMEPVAQNPQTLLQVAAIVHGGSRP